MNKIYLVPAIIILVVGIAIGYTLAYFAPQLSAQVFPGQALPGFQVQVPGGNPFGVAQAPAPQNQAAIDQCITNCRQGTTTAESCPRCGPPGNASRETHPYCEGIAYGPLGNRRLSYRCNESVCQGGTHIPGQYSGNVVGNPGVFGYKRVSTDSRGNELWFGRCEELKCLSNTIRYNLPVQFYNKYSC